MSDIIEKISKVLNQAEKAATPEEADAFFKRAQMLSTRYSIDLAVARQATAKKEQRETPVAEHVTIGQRGKNNNRHLVKLYLAIAGKNDVTTNIAHNSTYVLPFGFPSDIEVVNALYAHLSIQMIEAANAYLRTGAHKSETAMSRKRTKVWDDLYGEHLDHATGEYYRWEYEWAEKPLDGRTARANFYESFIGRISARLREAQREAEQAAREEQAAEAAERGQDVAEGTGTDLVLASKREEVAAFYKANSTARGSWSGNRGSTKHFASASAAGRRAGDNARLSEQRSIGGGPKSIAS